MLLKIFGENRSCNPPSKGTRVIGLPFVIVMGLLVSNEGVGAVKVSSYIHKLQIVY